MGAFGARGTIERMSRRTVPALAAAVVALGLVGCGADPSVPAPRVPAAPTPAPVAPSAPAKPGAAPTRAYEVAQRTLDVVRDGRVLEVTIWYPRAARRFPLVLFSHGLGGLPSDYADLLSRWAAAGFVVAAPAYPKTSGNAVDRDPLDVINQPADASYVIDRVLALDKRAGDPLRGRLATDRVAAAGHSAGGITTVGLFTRGRDDRLDAGIVLAGSSLGMGTSFSGTAAPQLFVHGERDRRRLVRRRQGRVRRRSLAEGAAQPAGGRPPAARRGQLVGRGRRHDRRVPAVDALRRPGRQGPHPARRRPGRRRGAGQPPLTRYT